MWSAIGSIIDNVWADQRQDSAQTFSAQQYAQRYQTQTKDMIAAGLNPMLATSQGASGQPSGSPVAPGNNFTAAVGQTLQNKLLEAQARKTNAEAGVTEQFGAQQAEASLKQTLESTGLTQQQINQVHQQTQNLVAELQRTKDDTRRIVQMVHLVNEQSNLATQHIESEIKKREVMDAQIASILAETGMTNLDLAARKALDNLGAKSRELKPIVDAILGLLTATKPSRGITINK